MNKTKDDDLRIPKWFIKIAVPIVGWLIWITLEQHEMCTDIREIHTKVDMLIEQLKETKKSAVD